LQRAARSVAWPGCRRIRSGGAGGELVEEALRVDLPLLAALHLAELGAAVGLEDHREPRAHPVGLFELALEAAACEVDLDRVAGAARPPGELEGSRPLAGVGDRDEGVARCGRG
jgi:hypothetical protein